jgi:hypothetical protein
VNIQSRTEGATWNHSPVNDSVAAEKAEAALAEMRKTREFFTDLAEAFRQGSCEKYGWRGQDFAQGIAARLDVVVEWIDHLDSRQAEETRDYRNHALGLVG